MSTSVHELTVAAKAMGSALTAAKLTTSLASARRDPEDERSTERPIDPYTDRCVWSRAANYLSQATASTSTAAIWLEQYAGIPLPVRMVACA